MADVRVNFKNERELVLFLRNLKKEWSSEKILKEMSRIGDILLSRSVEAPVPTDTGDLAGSSNKEVDKSKNQVTIGFNKVYAAFQDAGKKSSQTIKPKKKKLLFIPLTQKGRKHVLGRNPRDEGLKSGVDYVMVKQVTIKTKPYGSPIGPNRYFSGTLQRNKDFVFEELARRMSKGAERAKRKSGGS